MLQKDYNVKTSLYQLENFKNYRKTIGLARIRNHNEEGKNQKQQEDLL